MATAILELTNHCCSTKLHDVHKANARAAKIFIAEALVWVTALIVSILGLTNVISMPTAAAYGILALPCTMLVLFIPALIKSRCCQASNDYHAAKRPWACGQNYTQVK